MNKIKKFDNIEKYISSSRLSPYLDFCNQDEHKALKIYQLNLRLNGAFFPLVSMLEVALRNGISRCMSDSYPKQPLRPESWLLGLELDLQIFIAACSDKSTKEILSRFKKEIHQSEEKRKNRIAMVTQNELKRYYRNKPFFKAKTYEEQEEFIKEESDNEIKRHGNRKINDVLIANSNFALWTMFFDKEPYKFIVSDPNRVNLVEIFKLDTSSEPINRNLISAKLNDIRDFRNRLAHNESIILIKQNFDITYAQKIKTEIMWILKHLNEDLENYAEDIFTIETQLVKVEDYCSQISNMIKNK